MNLRARRGRKALKAADEAVEPPEDLDLLSEAEEEEDNGNETKQEKRDRLKKEAVKNKQLQKDFKKNTAAASKAVAELLPLLAKVTEEATKAAARPRSSCKRPRPSWPRLRWGQLSASRPSTSRQRRLC